MKITETLNQLVMGVLSGVDYASQLALETGKSIPVIHRQLEKLLDAKILTKKRTGKKVTYAINWSGITTYVKTVAPGAEHAFSDPYIQELFEKFVAKLKEAPVDVVDAAQTSLETTIDLFLDVFGMISDSEYAHMRKQVADKKAFEKFVKQCKHNYEHKQAADPRRQLLTDL